MHRLGLLSLATMLVVGLYSTDAQASLKHEAEVLAWSLTGHAALVLATATLPQGDATVAYQLIGPSSKKTFLTSSIATKKGQLTQTIDDTRCARTLASLSKALDRLGFRGVKTGSTCGTDRQPVTVTEQERVKVTASWLEGAGTFLSDSRQYKCGEASCSARVEVMNNTLFISENDKVVITVENIPQPMKLSAARADSGMLLLIRHHWGEGNTGLMAAYRSKSGATSALRRLRL